MTRKLPIGADRISIDPQFPAAICAKATFMSEAPRGLALDWICWLSVLAEHSA
jgi:hypothetical protein